MKNYIMTILVFVTIVGLNANINFKVTGMNITVLDGDNFHKNLIEEIINCNPSLEDSELLQMIISTNIFESYEKIDENKYIIKSKYLIKNIKIKGNYPLSINRILDIVQINSGDFVSTQEIRKQEKILENYYDSEGFINSKVNSKIEKNGYIVNIVYRIDYSDFYKIGDISFSGNKNFSNQELFFKTGLWKRKLNKLAFGRYKFAHDFEKKVNEYYYRKGFFNSQVTMKTVKDSSNFLVSINFEINENNQMDLIFSKNINRNSLIFDNDLILLDKKGIQSLNIIKNSIEKKWRHKGYKDAKVYIKKSASEIIINLNKGNQFKINKITLENLSSIPDKEINNKISSCPKSLLNFGYFIETNLENDMTSIKNLLISKGFYNAEILKQLDFDDNLVDIKIRIIPNEKTLIRKIEFEGVNGSESMKFKLYHKENSVFSNLLIYKDLQHLREFYADKGYPYVKANYSFTDNKLTYTIQKGSYVTNGNLFFTGRFQSSKKYLEKKINFTTNKKFTIKELVLNKKSLRSTNLFNFVDIIGIGLDKERTKIPLIIRLEEKKNYSLTGAIGYKTSEDIYGSLNIKNNNVIGYGKKFDGYSYYSNSNKELSVSLAGEYFQNTIIKNKFYYDNQHHRNKNFKSEIFGSTFTIVSPLNSFLNRNLNFNNYSYDLNSEINIRYRDKSTSYSDDSYDEYRKNNFLSFSPKISFSNIVNTIRPKKGISFVYKFDYSKDIKKSEVEFFKNEIEFISIIKMSNKVIFAYRTSFGKIFYFNDSFQLDSEKYFLGGLNTIRGYKQYMLFSQDNYAAGGSSFYLHSLETRFEYNENYEIASFIDIGRINEIDNQDSKTKYSVGLSFYYLSPIGPIGITYGHKLTEEVDKFGRLYLNIGYSF